MKLTPEQQTELAQFPAPLRALVEAELSAGNSISEIGHSFPAPPAGAYFKFARKVSTRPRSSGHGLSFYERNSSLYSGEFTDAKRFHFVLEPPDPPPLSPDMDAIRLATESSPLRSDRPIAPLPTQFETSHSSSTRPNDATEAEDPLEPSKTTLAPTSENREAISRTLLFQDKRPPQQIQFHLERDLMTLFVPRMDVGRLTLVGRALNAGCHYLFELRFEAASARKNFYSLRIEASWSDQDASNQDYHRKSFAGWFKHYTQDFKLTQPPKPGEASNEHYQALAGEALTAEQHLDSVPRLQQAIVDSMKQGATFCVAHKEGGSNIYWRDGSFVRSDYGEEPARRIFASEREFLEFLRRFYDLETSRNVYPNKVPEIDAWRLIYRLLRPN